MLADGFVHVQVTTLRVITCDDRLLSAAAPRSASARTMSRSEMMPATRRSAPSTTTCTDAALGEQFRRGVKIDALGSMVTTSPPLVGENRLDGHGSLPALDQCIMP